MKRVLLCWIGTTDLRASQGEDVGEGPIAQAVEKRGFDEVHLITNYLPDDRVPSYDEIGELPKDMQVKLLCVSSKKERASASVNPNQSA